MGGQLECLLIFFSSSPLLNPSTVFGTVGSAEKGLEVQSSSTIHSQPSSGCKVVKSKLDGVTILGGYIAGIDFCCSHNFRKHSLIAMLDFTLHFFLSLLKYSFRSLFSLLNFHHKTLILSPIFYDLSPPSLNLHHRRFVTKSTTNLDALGCYYLGVMLWWRTWCKAHKREYTCPVSYVSSVGVYT